MKHPAMLTLISLISVLVLSQSCVSTRGAVYFNDLTASEFALATGNLESIVQQGDLLSISVNSRNPEATLIFNSPNMLVTQASTVSGSMAQASGYLVDEDGFIQFPFLGNIRAAGLSKKELKEFITAELSKQQLLVDPIVNIRYLNYRISVLGEVARPSVINIPNEKVTLLEALGLAGDLTVYAKRDNVLLIREENGKKKITRIDLTSNELFTSPHYYLKSNDIIYVEPNKTKVASASWTTQWLPIVFSALSFGVIALDRLTR
ncbi:polysaccharide biosynthesis/export family protein [Pontibacter amylolyticus]|uniref:Polysaccharide biosynthesis protein n=1 Tax=Pontibacter amylolyticus TaxID=1424080 RepID=A0ABQ1W3X6_9BACT|nr:polysaccharide biosynthesis/export family protein [Pontibacter amylolyticus]GGG12455.1 polysaccharide biosynthesis protein [Pontibacter amylolyticus]